MSNTVREAMQATRDALATAGFTAANEADTLMELVLGRRYFGTELSQELTAGQQQQLQRLVQRRIGGEPLQYIAENWPFCDFELAVGPGVLIPRPETELLAETAICRLRDAVRPYVLDLCSGTGCLAIAIARAFPAANVTAVELYDEAHFYLKKNCDRLAPQIRAIKADALTYHNALQPESLDVVVANPPYVTPQEYKEALDELRYEPETAFIGGDDGLDFYRGFASNYYSKLKIGGFAIFETGFTQTQDVAAIMQCAGYGGVEQISDQFGLPRMVFGRRDS